MSNLHPPAMSNSKTVVLVTGCSRGGIGFALCEEFASRGCIVYAAARRLESMNGFTHENIHPLAPVDVTDDANVREAVDTVISREGHIDVLVNNAGVGNTGAVIDVDMQEIINTFNTNVFSVVRMAKAVIPHMASRKKGTIVNIGSIAGEIPVPWGGIYGASKAALHSITDALYMECIPLHINVVLVAPGGVKSNIAANQVERVKLPENSLYADYMDAILTKLNLSQGSNSMPADKFSQKVVGAVLKPQPPRYMTLAAMSRIYRVLLWFPRGWVLRLFWRRLGEGPRLAAQKQRK
ncbi:NAD-P-binding protein [Trametes polyzona]|nr:NAD-P-binding protein [Trametes polyzona]